MAAGWSEPVPGREFHPLKSSAFHGALFRLLRFYRHFVAYSTGGGRMESSTSSPYLAVPIVVAGLATLWTVWPEKYVAWIQAMKNKMPPAMRAGADGVQAIFPVSSTKPWYPKFLRVVGILLWVFLLWFAYVFYKF